MFPQVAARLGSFRPCVAVAAERHFGDTKLAAARAKFRGAIASPHAGQIRKQYTFGGQVFEQVQRFRAQMHQHRNAGFLAGETHGAVLPVHVVAFEVRNVTLARSQVPAQLIKAFPLRVYLGGDNPLVFLKRDGAFFLKLHCRPLEFRQDGPWKPIHVQGEIVNPTQVNIGGNAAQFQHLQEVRGVGFQNRQFADEVERLLLHRNDMAGMGIAGFSLGHLVHRGLPGALGYFGVDGGQIGAGNLQIKDGLAVGFVFGMEEGESLGLVFGAQADLLTGGGVLAVVNARPAEQNESRLHG